ncbi:MAG: putative glycoside hydrolase [Bacilli bacterium]
MAKRKFKYKIKPIIGSFLILFIIFMTLKGVFKMIVNQDEYYLAGLSYTIPLYDENLKQLTNLPRGIVVEKESKTIEKDNVIYNYIKVNNNAYYVNKNNLAKDKESIVLEKEIFVRTSTVLYEDKDTNNIYDVLKKGDKLEVVDYYGLNDNGTITTYKVKKDNKEGYVYGKYIVLSEKEALAHYKPDEIYKFHTIKGNTLGGGSPANLDYYPWDKPVFKDNLMPDPVYAWYLNSSSSVINNVDKYISLAEDTKINAFVVDIKDNKMPGYKSEVMKEYSPTNYKKANNSFENYKNAIQKLKNAGFYVIGRITVFKDEYFVNDHPEYSMVKKGTNNPYLHQGTYWPSPFQRSVWEFNVNLAKEAVEEMGFNEIQFDYIRFPDLIKEPESQGLVDFHNDYNEEKAQAIQCFLMYARDQLHKLNVYLSADVFGESANGYVTAYGQYWPAISNVVDVISGMPYPDHFSKYEYGFDVPVWTVPYDILTKWGSYVMLRQKEIKKPAKLRTWIQAYDVPPYKHSGGLDVNAEYVYKEIKALFDAGLTDGYMTWKSNSDIEKYNSQLPAYQKDYK